MSTKCLDLKVLPSGFLKLMEFHEAIDRIMCFMIKRKINCTVTKIDSLYSQLVYSQASSSTPFSLYSLCVLCALCPSLYEMREHADNNDTNQYDSHQRQKGNVIDIEIIFRQVPGPSESQAVKRKKLVLEAFTGSVYVRYTQNSEETHDQPDFVPAQRKLKSIKQINKEGWPEECNIEEICNMDKLISDLFLSPDVRDIKRMYDQFIKEHQNNLNIPNGTKAIAAMSECSADSGTSDEGVMEEDEMLPLDENGNVKCATLAERGGGAAVLAYLRNLPGAIYRDQIKHVEYIPARAARYADLAPPALLDVLQERLVNELGITRLYAHQARAIDALRAGKHAVVSTSTASGKSIIYNVPVIESILSNDNVTALYLFPTKALAQDQLRALLSLTADGFRLPVGVAVCDGDTDQSTRLHIQGNGDGLGAPHIVLTNPDMLHYTMLPDHRKWQRIYRNLGFVVIDEAHLYRGAFGAHVAAVLRRLLRVCLFYGRCPQFLCCSATIANPAEHMQKLVPLRALYSRYMYSRDFSAGTGIEEESPEAVTCGRNTDPSSNNLVVIGPEMDGAPQVERFFVVWNPPLRDNKEGEEEEQEEEQEEEEKDDGRERAAGGQGEEEALQVSAAAATVAGMGKLCQSDDGEVQVVAPNSPSVTHMSLGHSTELGPLISAVAGASPACETTSTAATTTTTTMSSIPPAAAFSPKQARFMQACEESRPSTMGPARDLTCTSPSQQQLRRQASLGMHASRRKTPSVPLQPPPTTTCTSTTTSASSAASTSIGMNAAIGTATNGRHHGKRSPNGTATATSSSATMALLENVPGVVRDPKWQVRYVGGWKRGNKSSNYPSSSSSSSWASYSTLTAADTNTDISARPGQQQQQQQLASEPRTHRVSTIVETARLFTALVKRRHRTLAFCKVRKLVELVLSYSLKELEAYALESSGEALVQEPDVDATTLTTGSNKSISRRKLLLKSVASYRGGYTKEERRSIEADLFSGKLLGVTATCALELGIDVGALDITLHMGFPGTFASLWQQAGRAGRGGGGGGGRDCNKTQTELPPPSAVSIMVCFECPIDQYFARQAHVLFHSPVEPAVLDVTNRHVLLSHLRCAAHEVPLNYHFTLPLSLPASTAPPPITTAAAGTGTGTGSGRRTTPTSTGGTGAFNGGDGTQPMKHMEDTTAVVEENVLVPAGVAPATVAPMPALVQDKDVWGLESYQELLQYMTENQQLVPDSHNGSSRSNRKTACCYNSTTSSTSSTSSILSVVWKPRHSIAASSAAHPARSMSLRQIDPVTISIVDDTRGGVTIDSLGYSRAFYELYEGAIFMHRAVQYLVTKLDLPAAVAHTKPVRVKYYTSARNTTDVNIIKVLERSDEDEAFNCGVVQVVSSVYGFVKRWLSTGEIFERVECSLPPLEYETLAFWIDLPLSAKRAVEEQGYCAVSAMHAANHALVALSPLVGQCDVSDLGTEHVLSNSAAEKPFRMMVYDKRSGGLGACTELYARRYEVLRQAKELMESCACRNGCPSCLLDARCDHYNHCLSRPGAIILLKELLKNKIEPASTTSALVAMHQTTSKKSSSSSSSSSSTGGFLDHDQLEPATAICAEQEEKDTNGERAGFPSPRQMKRQRALKKAILRDAGAGAGAGEVGAVVENAGSRKRNKQLVSVQAQWSESVPSFIQQEFM